MKKIFTFLIVVVSLCVYAQREQITPEYDMKIQSEQVSVVINNVVKDASEPIMLMPGVTDFETTSWANYWFSAAAGYVFGTNVFGDKAYGQHFVVEEAYQIVGATYWFGLKEGTTGYVTFTIWDMSEGTPGDVLYEEDVDFADIHGSWTDEGYSFNEAYTITFAEPVNVSNDYLIGVDISNLDAYEHSTGDAATGEVLYGLSTLTSLLGSGEQNYLQWVLEADDVWVNSEFLLANGAADFDIGIFPLIITEEDPTPEEGLIHYWHFNNAEITEDGLVFSDFSAVGEGVISYPGTGDGYMDFRTHRPADPVSNFNLRMGQEPDQGAILRVRNPANTRELIIAAPSTGYENLVVTFATTRSGSGGQEQEFYYSADNGNTWVQVGEAYEVHEHDPEAENFGYVYKVFDLSAHGEINNNPDLHFRIMSVGEGSDGSSGNQRFDNLTVDGSPVVEPELDLVHYWHFNNAEITEDDLVFSDFSAVGEGVISYPGTGDGYMDFRTHRPADPVSNFNLRMGQEPDQGAILRVRNPANTRELIIAAPSTGYENLVVTFATTRSGSGGQEQEFYYSADNGNTWVQVGEAYEVHEHDPEAENFGYVHKVFDLSAHGEINNNPDLHFRIMSVGEGSDGSSGNQRFDNLSVDGTPVETTLPATALSITSINQGNPVYANEPFSVTIQAIDEEGAPAAVDSDVEVSLSLATGTGILGGSLTGILEAGSFSVNIEGVTYDTVESDVSITASADDMEPATSETFDVLLRTYNLSLTINIPEAGELSGEGDYEAGEEVTIVADANEGYEFVRWTIDGEEISEDHSHTFAMPAQDLVIRAEFAEEITGDLMLVHYWHFNDLTGATITDPLESDYSIGVLSAYITYPGEGAGYMDARTHRASDPVSNFNLRLGQEPDQGAVLRARNPAATRELLFEIPSTGFESLVVTFATTRTENGSQEQRFEYSADGGVTWVQAGDDYEIPFIEDEEGIYLHKIIDLAGIEEVNDNPDLFFRILFVGEGNDNDSGNNRFDNFTVDGIPLSDDVSTFEPETLPTIFVNPNPARSYFNITVTEPGTLVSIYNISGQLLFHEKVESTTITLDTSTFGSGLYFIRGISPSKNLPETLRLVIP